MQISLSPIIKICLFSLSFLFALGEIAVAQVTPDNTVNTRVEQNGSVAEITGGEARGDNLFHSFEDFSVPTGNEAFFNNANDISNIFSRVTGGNISNIDGLISANGSANLFLINPAGIIFGEGASLDIGGSFYGSSATSILFDDGEFSAADVNNPLLTINAPIGLSFRDNPGEIVNRSVVRDDFGNFIGLEVLPGNNLALIGGNVLLESGQAIARGGNITIGGLSQAGTVDFAEDGSFSFPEAVERGDVSLSNAANVIVSDIGGGNINVNARNLTLSAGEFGQSSIAAGVVFGANTEVQSGDINIDLTEELSLAESFIDNRVGIDAFGNAGDININASSLGIFNGGQINAGSSGIGNGGTINITVAENIVIDSETLSSFNPDNLFLNTSGIFSNADARAVGNAGEINISTTNLTLTLGAQIDASTNGQGNGGAIDIVASDIVLDGEAFSGTPSGVISFVDSQGVGNAGEINVSATNLTLTGGGQISTSTLGQGDGGAINITVSEDIFADGETFSGFQSGVNSIVNPDALGNGGRIDVSTTNLTLTNGAQIATNTLGDGNGGLVNIVAAETITFDGLDPIDNVTSGATSGIGRDAFGNGGEVNVTATDLILTNGGRVDATTRGQGNGGNVNVNISDSIFISGVGEGDRLTFASGITANALDRNNNGGDINVVTDRLTIENGGTIGATNETSDSIRRGVALGRAGNIDIQARTLSLSNGARIVAEIFDELETGTESAIEEGANINLQIAEDITLRDNSIISARAFTDTNGGNLNIDSRFIIAFPNSNSDIIASAQQGQGGNISINAESVFGIEERPLNDATNDINASSEVFGLSGDISLETIDFNPLQGVIEVVEQIIVPQETTAQACNSDREAAARNGLNIGGKGGVPPAPELPLSSETVVTDDGVKDISQLPEPIDTGIGKIQLARGIEVTEKGIRLTAYRTNNAGERLPEIKANCGL